ncbi:MAG: metallophosphoesterase family protein [Candidatus Brocadiales bacterium]
MLYAVLGDVHSNFEALDTVLKDIEKEGPDKILSVGDIVGYAAEPGRCLAAVRQVSETIVAGNHDYAAVEKMDIDYFNPHAKEAALWTREHLSQEDKDFLSGLPLVLEMEKEGITLVHGTLYKPEQFYYLQTYHDAELSLKFLHTRICFIGHSHVPVAILKTAGMCAETKEEVSLTKAKQAIINVGSVGQPRDRDPRACYVLYDTERELIRFRRLEYDIEGASKKIIEAGLPEFEAERLKVGV